MVAQSKIEKFIKEWQSASKAELKSRLKSLSSRNGFSEVQAEIKAIEALLR